MKKLDQAQLQHFMKRWMAPKGTGPQDRWSLSVRPGDTHPSRDITAATVAPFVPPARAFSTPLRSP